MKYWIFIFPVFFFSTLAIAQGPLETPEGKALWKSIRSGKSDTNQVYRYLDYGFMWEAHNMGSAGNWYKKANELSKQIEFPLGEIKYRTNYSYVLNMQGRFAEGLKLNLEALSLAKANPQFGYEGKCLANIGTSYSYLGEQSSAITYYQRAIDWFETHKQPHILPSLYEKIAAALAGSGLFEKSLETLMKAHQVALDIGDSALILQVVTSLGISYANNERHSEALKFATRGKSLAKSLGIEVSYIENTLTCARTYIRLKNPGKAKPLLEECYKLVKPTGNVLLLSRILKLLDYYSSQIGDFSASEKYCLELVEIGKKNGDQSDLMGAYQKLARLRSLKKDYASAYDYQLKYCNLYDTLEGIEVKRQVQELDTRFQAARKEKKILLLEKEKDRQKTWIISLIAGVLVVVGVGFLIYRNISIRRKIAENKVIQLQQERQLIATNSLLKGQDEERSRLARDLHDGLGGMLSGLKFSLNNMKGNMLLDEENANAFSKSIGQLDSVIAEMRRVAHSMMPEALVRFGLKEATQDLCDQLAKSSGLQIHFQAIGMEGNLEKSVSVALYRIEQELLNNILKHAEASEITVQLVKDEGNISLTVEDNGKGFDPATVRTGAGLTSIRTRVEALGGKLDVQSKPGEGSSFLVEIESKVE